MEASAVSKTDAGKDAKLVCGICRYAGDQTVYTAREMMQGTREEFTYFECGQCGCLQIAVIPDNLAQYYSEQYYSVKRFSPLKRFAMEQRLSYVAGEPNLLGRLVAQKWRPETDQSLTFGFEPEMEILDVGCGNGIYLRKLFELGYRRLRGIDPYMDASATRTKPFVLERKSLYDLDPARETFDIILFNHSFEHIADQHETLIKAKSLLRPGGRCVLRIPFASSYAWQHYRTDWVQLDAPRHLFLHTNESLKLLTEQVGMRLEKVVHDSTVFQFWASEQYRQGISLRAENSWHVDGAKSPFSDEDIRGFQVHTDQLNRENRGDQITAYLIV
jgi:2-polyprenyl-3-methyl-5-hydroxy-6-metoxy-1,4-benzoquinol methylase